MLRKFHLTVVGDPDDTSTLSDEIASRLTAQGVRVVTPLKDFLREWEHGRKLYLPYDGHWNGRRACLCRIDPDADPAGSSVKNCYRIERLSNPDGLQSIDASKLQ